MKIDSTRTPGRFHLDAERLARFHFARGDEALGLDLLHGCGRAAAVAARFADALEAGAILVPEGVEPVVCPVGLDSLVLAVRERRLPEGVVRPRYQVLAAPFRVCEVASATDETFAGCCTALRRLLHMAERLLPDVAALAMAGLSEPVAGTALWRRWSAMPEAGRSPPAGEPASSGAAVPGA